MEDVNAYAAGLRLDGRVAIVSGGASGIGLAACRRLAAAGAVVAVADLDGEAAARAAAAIPRAEAVRLDVADGAACVAAVDGLVARHGRLDICVNNAGLGHVGACHATADADFERLWRVNVLGVHHLAKAALAPMRAARRGVFVNVASIAVHVPLAERFAYGATKAAVLAMTRSLALDYVKEGIRANSVSPARVHTPLVDAYLERSYPPDQRAAKLAELSAYQPIGRMGTPDEVAAVIHVLASDASAFTTGCDYPVDGGSLFCR